MKKRKLTKTRRVKVSRPGAKKTKRETMKKWEWWLFIGAFAFAIVWVILLGLKGMTVINDDDVVPTPTVVETPLN